MSGIIFEQASVLADGEFKLADVTVGEDGRIEKVLAPGATPPDTFAKRINLHGMSLVPGFLDQHFHGLETKTCVGNTLQEIAEIEARNGVTGFLAGLACKVREPLLALIERKGKEMTTVAGAARCLGFFLEGPFVKQPGAIPKPWLMDVDLGYAREILAAGGTNIQLMMVSPELEGVTELIELLVEAGVVVALGHTNASLEQVKHAVDAGATVATHVYNVIEKLPDIIEPGCWPVGCYDALVADDRVTCELICDGIHVHPILAKMVFRTKGPNRLAIITDSNVGAGLKPGRYEFPGWPAVTIREGDAVRDAGNNGLCGSAITMAEAVRRAPRVLGCSLAQACTMAGPTIANALKLGHAMGKIAPGYWADLVILDQDAHVAATCVAGQLVYQKHPGLVGNDPPSS